MQAAIGPHLLVARGCSTPGAVGVEVQGHELPIEAHKSPALSREQPEKLEQV